MAIPAGAKLGPYEILALLRKGGMGEVYIARDPRLRREVAIKALELDDSLAEAHTSLGLVKMYYDWDWAGAGRESERRSSSSPATLPRITGMPTIWPSWGNSITLCAK